MTHPRTSRKALPTPASLSLTGAHAKEDLERLGWLNEQSTELLWALSGAADANLALNNLIRLMDALQEDEAATGGYKQLDEAMCTDIALRVRLIALLGASSVLGDHLVANPTEWKFLAEDIPSAAEMLSTLLGCVGAVPAFDSSCSSEQHGDVQVADHQVVGQEQQGNMPQDTACSQRTTVGTYRAALGGVEAEITLKKVYRSLLMRIAAHDLAGTYPENDKRLGQPHVPFSVISRSLTDLADAALSAALSVAVRNTYGEQSLNAQLCVIAMGKSGARELNYISDVDVVFVAEPADSKTTRLASEFIRIGCRSFFEVDAALRPEGKRGALVRTLESHIAYYKRWAHTWEFQALLKARPMTGSMNLGKRYQEALSPMVWNASQRESFVDDVQAMRGRVLDNVPKNLKDRELKLGEGGLRDVEFAVQLLQMVHGRSDESLRTPATIDALAALIKGGYIGREDGAELINSYEFLRLLEHRLQLQKVKRTHTLPEHDDQKNWRWLAHAAGYRGHEQYSSVDKLDTDLKKVRSTIAQLHNRLFYRPLLNSVVNFSTDAIKLSEQAAKLQLAALGYKYADRAFEHLKALASGKSRKAKIQAMLLPTLMDWLSDTADPDAGLLNYRKLSDAAHDRIWFLRMLRDEGIVGQRLMKILGNSPYTSDLLISAPDVVKQLGDGAAGPKLLERRSTNPAASLIKAASRHKDPDKAISVARALRRVELARISSADILGMLSVQEVCLDLSYIWDAVLEAALTAEIADSLNKGEVETQPASISIIGMGRLGGAELGYGSDADVMFVCDPCEGVEENDAVRWAITICDRLRTRLAKPSGDPPLEVDLGLRPEGRSGAVVRTLESYDQYYQRWGEIWEIQALLRATWIAGDKELGQRFLHMIDKYRYPEQGATEKVIREVRRMKARVDNERLPRGADRNTHTKLGRGALTDIEWTVQLLTLMHAHQYEQLHNTSTLEVLDVIKEKEIISAQQVDILKQAWLTATKARNAIVLVRGKRTDQIPKPGAQLVAVAGAAGWDPHNSQEFVENYLKVTRRARQVVDQVFWGEMISEHE
ncbi:bifunctional [glutamine synthetase] adenylyltransferase/[glutamine synthetase]-adenylyl-L-tyrosine phosphorylase [Corynebacterium sp. sy039]|uniref:bifunctional [glutamine synthetase] adenylyltransferase/[glutamine synthetase]-adenylyl-L-tyrosine phosphorylase n=1 Tax=Corynebacterium sp. sy039 TaxID=2599641 RepID=UPI0011B61B62|nr:bifunctional [glutamine synthetase] adenylyltransferase/[glutamine synthetase]-adenylyl-L-tyrosine phosphorylase [Corynebacterium sp. sy039]QDZ42979.1 bifunctional [glutamine synthetase] adenylyltransferase/[glutamine synthetase]-adenylyl-L-tyrosine phosphorylase [Corynebacterium sp. sy039]